jgi:protein-S-isoprenylcysteine O-methyltransferase Ste14
MNTISAQPKLLKKRINHTRWFVAALFPLIIFTTGLVSMNAVMDELFDCVGTLLIVTCILGRSYCTAFIGGIKNDIVMQSGPFSVVRNPLYVFSFLGLLGVAVVSDSVAVLIFLMVAFVVYYKQVVAREEAFLLHKFGVIYQNYLNEVPRWLPKWSLWNEPDEIVMRPYFLRHTMIDAMAFLLPLFFFDLIEVLHANNVLPSYLILP